MLEIRKAAERGIADFGWLNSRHTFSFGEYHDPLQNGFSDLLVINDDRVSGGKGFGTHAHRDMEIFTYVLDGELEHKDSMGTGSIIRPGDVQMMSAGTGIRHSEFNHSKSHEVHFLQIWIVPNRFGMAPRYQQKYFSPDEKRGNMRLIISPAGDDGSLAVYQDARVYAGLIDGNESREMKLDPKRYAYVHVASGRVELNGNALGAGDGARVRTEQRLSFTEGEDAEVLVFDLRANEQPEM